MCIQSVYPHTLLAPRVRINVNEANKMDDKMTLKARMKKIARDLQYQSQMRIWTQDDACVTRRRSKRRRGSYASQSSLGSVGRIFPPKSFLQPQQRPPARSEISVTRLPSRQGSVAARAASESELDQGPLQEPGLGDQESNGSSSSLRSQTIKARRPKKRRLHPYHYQDAKNKAEFKKRKSLAEDRGEDLRRGLSEECKSLKCTQGQMMETTFGKGHRDKVWSLIDVHLLGLPAPKDTALTDK